MNFVDMCQIQIQLMLSYQKVNFQSVFSIFIFLRLKSIIGILQQLNHTYCNTLQISLYYNHSQLFDKSIMENQKCPEVEVSNPQNKTKQIKKGRPYKRRQLKPTLSKKHFKKPENNAQLLLKKIYEDILGLKADEAISGEQKGQTKQSGTKCSIQTTDAIHFKQDQMVGEKQKIQIQAQNNDEFLFNKNEVFLDISSAIIDYFSGQVCYTFTDKQRQKLVLQKNSRINWENYKDWNLQEETVKQALILKTNSFQSSRSQAFVKFLLEQFAYYFDRQATTDWYKLVIKIWKHIVKERKLLLKNAKQTASIYIDSHTLAQKIMNDIKGPSFDEFPFFTMSFTKIRLSKKVSKKQHEQKLKTLIQELVQVILNESPFQKQ